MMNINGTLFIQVINFLLAYVLFKWILLKPAVHSIKEEESHKHNLEKSLENQQAILLAKNEEHRKNWQMCQEYFLAHTPKIAERELYVFQHITPEMSLPQIPESDVVSLINQMEELFIKKVMHGNK